MERTITSLITCFLFNSEFSRLIALLVFLLFSISYASSESDCSKEYGELEDGYYVVVGVFSSVENAKAFNNELKGKGYTSDYAFSPSKKLHYCYLLRTDSLALAKNRYYELKKLPEFANAWILKVKNFEESKVQDSPQELQVETVTKTTTPVKSHPSNQRDITLTHHSYKVLVNVRDENNREVLAIIKVTSGPDEKVLASLKPNHENALHIPKKESQTVQLVCEAFGYHKTVVGLPLGDLIALSAMRNVKIEGEKIYIDFALDKCKKGDFMTMFNVFFHSGSNIMRLKSKEELQILLTVMKDNPGLKILVHGHTNGNSGGPITKIPDNCEDFFNPSITEKTSGSAAKLSLLRAEAIKMYLMKNGIEADRIDVKGWGGKKMIYKENSPHCHMNVRVEIEVVTI